MTLCTDCPQLLLPAPDEVHSVLTLDSATNVTAKDLRLHTVKFFFFLYSNVFISETLPANGAGHALQSSIAVWVTKVLLHMNRWHSSSVI